MIVSSSQDAIKRVVAAFERSDWSEIDVRSGNLRVHLSTTTTESTAPAATTTNAPLTPDDTGDGASDDVVADDAAVVKPHAPPTGAHVVVSPSPGIFWRSPEPGLPPFADVGDTLDASATVCIVEVMKLINHVKAGVSGEVVAVYSGNGETVQKGQALFAIVPAGSSL